MGQSHTWYLEAGFRPGLPEGSPRLQAPPGCAGGPVPDFFLSITLFFGCGCLPRKQFIHSFKVSSNPTERSPAPALEHLHPLRGSWGDQSELRAGWGCCPARDRLRQRNSWREGAGGRGRKLGRTRAGAASCREWGLPGRLSPPARAWAAGWWPVARPAGVDPPRWRPNPAGSRAHWLSTNGEHFSWGSTVLPTRASRWLAAGCPTALAPLTPGLRACCSFHLGALPVPVRA